LNFQGAHTAGLGNRRCTPIDADGTDEHPRASALIGGFKFSSASLSLQHGFRTKVDQFVNFVSG